MYQILVVLESKVNIAAGDEQGVGERYQLMDFLGRKDAGNPGYTEDIAFGD